MTRKFTLVLMALASLIVCRAFAFYNPVVEDRKIDIDVNADYDNDIDDADESIEMNPGGIVVVGGWTNITIQQNIITAQLGDPNTVRLSWKVNHIEVAETRGGAAIVPDGYIDATTAYKDYPGLNTTKTLWVHGISVSQTARAEHLRLELIHFDQAYDPNSHDEIALTVVEVDKIEYRRLDQTAWVTDLNIAAGAKNTDVHKAKVRITMKPAFAGLPVTASTNGPLTYGTNVLNTGVLTPTTSQNTDASGQVTCEYRSGDKEGVDFAIIVTEVAGSTVSLDLGTRLRQKWDIAGAYDWRAPLEFYPEEADDVRFYPTLEAAGGAGAITGHSMEHYTPRIELLVVQYDLAAGTVAPNTVIGEYPDYWYVSLPACMPSGFVVTDFVEITSPTEESPGGIYRSTHTVHDWWDFNFATGVLTDLFVTKYELGACDQDVYSTTPFP